ncbi:hypothetical protein ACLQ2R_32950 [Streptosporangium sp. DT93]|uniref:hypothetical protein n=1 Tax=Streptosporangium sp. DT93 TaxID=3393428 RepID=UPI003CE73EF2
MAITESELREILDRDDGGGHAGTVTLAGVHRRARAIRRRRAAAAVAAAGLAGALAFGLTGGDTATGREWTGLMAQPPGALKIVKAPVGGLNVHERLEAMTYRRGGVREELTFTRTTPHIQVTLRCHGPADAAALWVDGHLVRAGACTPGGTVHLLWQGLRGEVGSRHTVTGIVLRTRDDTPVPRSIDAATAGRLIADQWPFDSEWSIRVERLAEPECRDRVRQLDPRTGEMVQLSCADDGGTPSKPALGSS